MNTAIIGLGSNIDPQKNIEKACKLIRFEFELIKKSHFIQTKPVGYTQQADFINGAVLVETELQLDDFKEKLKGFEQKLGRKVSKIKFGPRTIDLDILVWNGKVIDSDVYERSFLQTSITELLPTLEINA